MKIWQTKKWMVFGLCLIWAQSSGVELHMAIADEYRQSASVEKPQDFSPPVEHDSQASQRIARESAEKEPTATNMTPKKVVIKGSNEKEIMSNISMDELVEHLKETKAIGFFTKLAIRSDVIGFQDKVQKIREKNQLKEKMVNIKASFDGLLLKIMALLEKDPDLSKKIYLARHSIFKSLMEVKT